MLLAEHTHKPAHREMTAQLPQKKNYKRHDRSMWKKVLYILISPHLNVKHGNAPVMLCTLNPMEVGTLHSYKGRGRFSSDNSHL